MNTIVVVRLGRLGDLTLTGPTIKNLRFLYPRARIAVVTRDVYADLARALPAVDEVVTFPAEGSYLDLMNLSSRVDDLSPDLIVDLHKNFRSFHLAKLSRAPYKVVYSKRRKQRQAAVKEKVFVPHVPHTVDLYNLVIDKLKGKSIAWRPDLILPEEFISGDKASREYVVMAPGASSPVKTWPTDRFAELAERIIADFSKQVHVYLGRDEADLANYFSHLPTDSVVFHHNELLPDLIAGMSRAVLTVTNDSGLMHVSSAVGTPTAALFGPTHKQLGFYPLGVHDVMLEVDETCRPCSLHGDKPCYREQQYCFTRLTVDAIYDKISEMIDRITLRPAVFIDRDGTLIEDKHYLADPDKVVPLPGALDAVRRLKEAGYRIAIVSNQSGVARGFYPIETVELVNRRLTSIMTKAGCAPDDIRFCPHLEDGDVEQYSFECHCRKPKPGMLEESAANLGIDLKRSYMIGDKYSDVICGRAAGTISVLVRTGEGRQTEENLPDNPFVRPDFTGDHLGEVAEKILSNHDS